MKQQLSDILKLAINASLDTIHTALPGMIETYDASKKKVSVKPLIKKKFKNGEVLSFPIITNVPVIFPGTKRAVIQYPLQRGDGCLIIFSERSMERYLSSAIEDVEPQDPRKFSLSDAICIPGLFPFGNVGKAGSSNSAMEIINDGGNIELNGNNKSFVTYTELDSALTGLKNQLNAHVHTSAAPGSPTSVPTVPMTLDISASKTQTIKTGG